jgi:hypothetical protein
MGAKESEEMKEARRLILGEGLTVYAAAKRAGLTSGAIYKAPWYKNTKAEDEKNIQKK